MVNPTPGHPALRLEDRINRIQLVLKDFQVTDDTRLFLYNIHRNNGSYCLSCSPARTPGACGPTCSLLSPCADGPEDIDYVWLGNIKSDHRLYRQLVADMQRYGHDAAEHRVVGWEKATEDLRQWALNLSEVHAERGWPFAKVCRPTIDLDMNWSFEKAWRKGKQQDNVATTIQRKNLKRESSNADVGDSKRRRRR